MEEAGDRKGLDWEGPVVGGALTKEGLEMEKPGVEGVFSEKDLGWEAVSYTHLTLPTSDGV